MKFIHSVNSTNQFIVSCNTDKVQINTSADLSDDHISIIKKVLNNQKELIDLQESHATQRKIIAEREISKRKLLESIVKIIKALAVLGLFCFT